MTAERDLCIARPRHPRLWGKIAPPIRSPARPSGKVAVDHGRAPAIRMVAEAVRPGLGRSDHHEKAFPRRLPECRRARPERPGGPGRVIAPLLWLPQMLHAPEP